MNFKSLISEVNCWNDFKNVLETKTKLEKGKAFEELTKYYFKYNPVYKTKLKNVWLHNEVPPSVLKKLNLPPNDQGIDLIAETTEGAFWAIQCKYFQDEDQRLSHRAISTFVSLSKGIAQNIAYCLVCTTVDDYAKIYHGKNNIGFCNSDEWRKLDKNFFDWLRNILAGTEKKLIPYNPKPHQARALKEAKNYFVKEKSTRGKLVFPCGAGKSLTGYWIAKELKAKSIIVAVPSLSLVKQTLEVYLRESVANNDKVSWLCICSDEGIGKNDDVVIHTNEIGVPCVTDKVFIADWLKENAKNKTIVFTTYQSGKTIADACKIANHSFDVGIMDEAHKTVGEQDKLFSYLLFDKNIKIARRIFMTATERRYAGSSDTILSMDDVNVYGETFAQLSFKEAIDTGILSDYRIITLFISNEEVKKLIEQNAYVKPTGKEWDKETEARTLASLIALRKAMTEHPIHHAVTFHSSIKKAEAFEQSQSVFSAAYPQFADVKSFHVSGAMPTSVRGKIVDEFAATDKAIITNAKCLTEGVDVPNIDCVLFADPRKSTIDIVQALGRALRKKEGKEFGYVILPVFTETDNQDEIIESDEFKEILSTLRALASNDERIIEYFRDISKGRARNKAGSLIQFEIDERIAEKINEQLLIDYIQLKTWDRLAKLSWMPFEEARSFVHSLKLKNQPQWQVYVKSGKKPQDIPANPNNIYKGIGWVNLGDWLGTGTMATQQREYLPFNKARSFARSLNLKGSEEWAAYCALGKKPDDIPSNPKNTYKDFGWAGYGDWLGTGNIANFLREYRSFDKARAFARSLNLKNVKEWNKYCDSGKRPKDIPRNPSQTYKDEGWISYGDWLGTGSVSVRLREYRPLEEARRFVHSLKLKNFDEWVKYCQSGKNPKDIPVNPNRTYKDLGWISFGDWLGTGSVSSQKRVYRPFNKALAFVRALKLKNSNEWNSYCRSGDKPEDIPQSPRTAYKNKGWIGFGDWLGTGNIAVFLREYRPFNNARKFVHSLKLKNTKEWRYYSKSEKKPKDIPAAPERTYKNKGWVSYGDWLGTGFVTTQQRAYLPYSEVRKYVHKLNLSNVVQWNLFCKSGKKPIDIPSNPQKNYKDKGWKGWGDWLGTGKIADNLRIYRSFKEARAFVRSLNLKNIEQWKQFCKSEKKPEDIPSYPNQTYKNKGWKGWADFLGKE